MKTVAVTTAVGALYIVFFPITVPLTICYCLGGIVQDLLDDIRKFRLTSK